MSDARLELEIVAAYAELRLEKGLSEPQALTMMERTDDLWDLGASKFEDGWGDFIRSVLRKNGYLDERPVGWDEEHHAALAQNMTFEDVLYFVSRIVDAPREEILIDLMLSAQGYLASILSAIGPAIHLIFESPHVSAGKSRCAEAFTFVGGGVWYDAATIPFLKASRRDGPRIVGIDEGDEAEKDQPGMKAYLLASHRWDAKYGKFSEPDEKGRRAPEDIPYGGPVFITFRKKPWPAIVSRAHVSKMERSKRPEVSDDGAGKGMKCLLGPCATWLRQKCQAALQDRDEKWALLRVGAPDFRRKLDRVAGEVPLLRQRDKARTLLLIAELLSVDLEREIREFLKEEEIESENATVIEAIEADPLYRKALKNGEPLPTEDLRLSVQKRLHEGGEWIDLNRRRFAAAIEEMGYSKKTGPTWKRMKLDGRDVTVILPALFEKSRKDSANPANSARPPYGEGAKSAESAQSPSWPGDPP